ncbi:major facilitator superfamily domain-containing protein [Kockovaella imperatae]|uniref:Major facilitator superfamily domain-containing protein n=1 Tax=Kockovaella imperatae TaxID=4999 RepID=A0A1Y1UGU9_9TREE|nr:major facilitator superfamily domain-containing protein [Kockovaella imperatae]ORX37291.1 major facilitator superfamily domain-containing protein [Kockovaella imperatae]
MNTNSSQDVRQTIPAAVSQDEVAKTNLQRTRSVTIKNHRSIPLDTSPSGRSLGTVSATSSASLCSEQRNSDDDEGVGDPSVRREEDDEQHARPVTGVGRTPTSQRPYSAFPQRTKWLIVILGGLAGIFSPISSNIFVPAIPTLARDFNRSEQDITLGVTIYLIFQAITPSFFGSLSDTIGRRPVYIGTLTLYIGANIGLALMPTSAYWMLLFFRALQSTGGSAVISIGAGSIADIAEPHERGKFFAVFQLGALIGPAFGPLLGGVLADTLGWRSIFWFLTISTGVVMVPLILFFPETLRSLVGDGSIPPPMSNMSPMMLYKHSKMKRDVKKRGEEWEHTDRPPRKPYQPLSAFLILLTPEVSLIFVYASLLYMQFYMILTLYSTALRDSYHLNDLKIGLAYLPNGFGTLIAAQLNGRQLDWMYRREVKRADGDYRKAGEDFRLELTRIRCLTPFVIVFLSASTAQGWTLQVKAPLAATLVLGFFTGLGTGTMSTATLYAQDLMPGKGGAASASFNLVRCLLGAVGTAIVQILYKALGAGWTLVLLTGICLIGTPIPVLVIRYARPWREKRRELEEAKLGIKDGGELGQQRRNALVMTSGRIERPVSRIRKEPTGLARAEK